MAKGASDAAALRAVVQESAAIHRRYAHAAAELRRIALRRQRREAAPRRVARAPRTAPATRTRARAPRSRRAARSTASARGDDGPHLTPLP